tara:strand:- start:140 stop:742 length:603 start_codon:yes stop_codon:yes gene_type:complete
MKKNFFPLAFILTAFLILYSCSAEEEDTTPQAETTSQDDPPETWLEMYDGKVFIASLEQLDSPSFSCSNNSQSSRKYVTFYNAGQGETFLKKGGFSCNDSFEDFSDIRCYNTKEKDYDGFILEITSNDLEGFSYNITYNNEVIYKERYEINSDGYLNLYSEYIGEEEALVWSLSLIDDKSWSDYTEFDGIVCADSYQDEG